MHSLRITALALATVLAAACGGDDSTGTDAASVGSNGTAHATGALGTIALSGITNALGDVTTDSKGSFLSVILAETATCGDVTAGPSKNAVFLGFSLYTIDGTTKAASAPTAPGTFTLDVSSAGPYAEADVISYDGTCAPSTASGKFESGTVTVTTLSGGKVAGTFDLTAGTDHATGSFSSAECAGAAGLDEDGSAGSCH